MPWYYEHEPYHFRPWIPSWWREVDYLYDRVRNLEARVAELENKPAQEPK